MAQASEKLTAILTALALLGSSPNRHTLWPMAASTGCTRASPPGLPAGRHPSVAAPRAGVAGGQDLKLAGRGHCGPAEDGRSDIVDPFLHMQPGQLLGAGDRYGGHVDMRRRPCCSRQSLLDDDVTDR